MTSPATSLWTSTYSTTALATRYGMALMLALALGAVPGAAGADEPDGLAAAGFARGAPAIESMSVLSFGGDGTLFIGDSKAATVWAVALAGEEPRGEVEEPMRITDLEGKLGAMLGAAADEVLIHDLAVHPGSKNQFLAVSRGRKAWKSLWEQPNDVADATILVRVTPEGEITDVSLAEVPFQSARLTNPVAPEKMHPWMEHVSLRVDAITDVEQIDGAVLVAGLSNEEFASTLWRIPFPFTGGEASATTLEIYHGAHGEFETAAPIRTFLPYTIGGDAHVLASYLCTPLVTFLASELVGGAHVKGKTVAEFGAGNSPLDMIRIRVDGEERILMSNSMLPLLSFDPAELTRHPAIVSKVPTYTYGVPYTPMAGAGVQHIDRYGDTLVAMLQRTPSGRLDLTALPVAWLR